MNPFDLPKAPSPVKLLCTLFLVGVGISYLFGLLMVVAWGGLSPETVVRAYSQRKSRAAARESRVTEEPIDLDEEIVPPPHVIGRDLLVQDTHVHLPVYALIAVILSLIAAGLHMKSSRKNGLIFLLFLGGWLDFSGMWAVKYGSDGFAYVTLAGGWLMFGAWLVVAVVGVKQMWFEKSGG